MSASTGNRSRLSYKIGFAARHPGQIVPYVHRVCVDAWLRAGARDHVSYYRSVMRHKASHSTDVAVGSRSHNQWIEFGQMQHDYLVKQGLEPADRMLEIGCGNLRAGRLFIKYLEAGHYYGVDISPEILLSAQQVIEEDRLQEKVPQLMLVSDLTFRFLPSRYFNVVNANSVFTHCPIDIIEECIANVGRIMAPDAIFDFTFYRTDGPEYQVHHEDFYYQTETLVSIAAEHHLTARLMDDWLDPWDKQPKLRLTRAA
jgi:SAM-dependent methyltransferase